MIKKLVIIKIFSLLPIIFLVLNSSLISPYIYNLSALAQTKNINNDEAEFLINLGIEQQKTSEFEAALISFQEALKIYHSYQNKEGESIVLSNLGNTYQLLGNYDKAIQYHEYHLKITRQIQNREGESIALGNLGVSYQSIENYRKAILYNEESLRISYEINNKKGESSALGNLGNAYYSLRDYEKSIQYHERSLAIKREAGDYINVEITLNNLGNSYQAVGNYDLAIQYYQQSLIIKRRLKNRQGEGLTLSNLGELWANQKQPDLAIFFYKQSVSILETIRTEIKNLPKDSQESYIQSVSETYRALAELLITQGRLGEAQQVLERLKVQDLNSFTKGVRSATTLPEISFNISENQIKAKYNSLITFGAEYYACEQQRCSQYEVLKTQYQNLSTEFQTFIEQLKQKLRDVRLTQVDKSTQDFQNSADRIVTAHSDSILIYPLVLPDKTQLLWASKGGVLSKAATCLLGENALYKKVTEFQTLLRQPGDETQLKATGKELYDCLVKPIEEELTANHIKHLIFVPDRSTNYLPMGALYDGKQYLIQRFAISNILSAGLTNTDDKLQSVAKTSVLALGLTEARGRFGALPNVESELGAIVRQQGGTGIYPGDQYLNQAFTKTILEDKIRGRRILHIATHGEFKPANPRESYFLLGTGTPYLIPDIQNLRDLKDIHLVVLSACETGLGGPDGLGLEVMGMSSFFMGDQNKAKAVMASLWQVNDASTSQLMQQFYQNLAIGTMSKAEALRQAQLSMIQGNGTGKTGDRGSFTITTTPTSTTTRISHNLSHPFYWAPFILIGNGL